MGQTLLCTENSLQTIHKRRTKQESEEEKFEVFEKV